MSAHQQSRDAGGKLPQPPMDAARKAAGTQLPDELDSVMGEITAHCARTGIAVYWGNLDAAPGSGLVREAEWVRPYEEADDWRNFLKVAKGQLGSKCIVYVYAAVFDSDDLDEADAVLTKTTFPPENADEASRLRRAELEDFAGRVGKVGALMISWPANGTLHRYGMTTGWMDRYLVLIEENDADEKAP